MKITAFGSLDNKAGVFMTVFYRSQEKVKMVYLKKDELEHNVKNVYNAFESLFRGHASVEIMNTPVDIDVDFSTISNLKPSPLLTINYEDMTNEEKDIIESFINLIEKIK